MIEEVFPHKNSVIHRIDPRVRFIAVFFFSFITALSKDFYALVFSFIVASILAVTARLNFFELLKRILAIFGFLFFIWITLPFSYKGEALFYIKSFPIAKQGVIYAGMITLKSVAIALFFTSLLATMSVAVLGNALNKLKLSEKLVYLLLITYRYLFVFKEEYNRLFRAAKLRGFKSKTNIHSYKTFATLAGMLLIKAFKRAERVHFAMLCRGFKGKFYSLEEFGIEKRDWVFAFIIGCSFIFILFLDIIAY